MSLAHKLFFFRSAAGSRVVRDALRKLVSNVSKRERLGRITLFART